MNAAEAAVCTEAVLLNIKELITVTKELLEEAQAIRQFLENLTDDCGRVRVVTR